MGLGADHVYPDNNDTRDKNLSVISVKIMPIKVTF